MNRKERMERSEFLEKNYKKVYKKLSKIKGFQGLEIGFKRKDGAILKDQIVYRVLVTKKMALENLDSSDVMPKKVEGIDIDVIEVPNITLEAIGSTNLPDNRKRSLLVGGIQIGNGTGSVGTLGCIAIPNSDNTKRIILSNEHVLYAGGVLDGQKIGSPNYSKSSCCDCNYVATNIRSNSEFDCAIAEIKDGVSVSNSIDEIGTIMGFTSSITMGDIIRKRGRTTGLTEGEVEAVNISTFQITVKGIEGKGRKVGFFQDGNEVIRDDNVFQEILYNDLATEKFSFAGDSGSVYVLHEPGDPDHNKIVGLHNSGDADFVDKKSYGFRIDKVIEALQITIHTSANFPDGGELVQSLTYNLNMFEEQMSATPLGNKLIQLYYKHYSSVLNILESERKAKVLWHRNMGPRYVAALQRAIKDNNFKIPTEIESKTRLDLLESIEEIVQSFGSDEMILDFVTHKDLLFRILKSSDSIEDLIAKTENWKTELV